MFFEMVFCGSLGFTKESKKAKIAEIKECAAGFWGLWGCRGVCEEGVWLV